MRIPIVVLFLLTLLAAAPLAALDVYLPITGTVNNFHTDVRIFNPSATKDIQITASFLRVGNTSNAGFSSVTLTVAKRQMRVFDDVVTAIFNTSGLGGILLSSPDEFDATARIYAIVPAGTLGQFEAGLPAAAATANGVLLQLKSSTTFRTNVGLVNPRNGVTNVTFKLFDKNNNLVSTGTAIQMPPFAVIGPTNIASTFFFTPGAADLSDAWMSYTADNPVFAYASVIDNGTTDPTYIPAVADVVPNTPPPPEVKVFDVSERSGTISVTPALTGLKVGDQVKFRIVATDVEHGFSLVDPNFNPLIGSTSVEPNLPPIEKTFTIASPGTHQYFCTLSGCSAGHSSMVGSFTATTP